MQKIDNSKEDALKLVKQVKEETAKYRSQFEKSWREYEDAYYGKQHKSGEKFKTVKNNIFKITEIQVPILTDSMPGTSIISDSADRQDDAAVLEKSIRHVYNDQNLQLMLPSIVRSMLVSAPGYIYAYYDPDADSGNGKIRYKKIPWESVYLDGNVSTIEDSAKAVIEIPMRRDEIARMFPHKKDEILGMEGNQSLGDNNNDDEDNFEKRDVSSQGRTSSGRPSKYQAKDIVKYVETWIKSYDLMNIPQEETHEELEKEQNELMQGIAPDIKKWENHKAHKESHAQGRAMMLAQLGLSPDASIEDAANQAEMLSQQNPEMDVTKILLSIKLYENHIEEHTELEKLNPTGQKPKYTDGWRLLKSIESIILYDGENPEQMGEIPLIPFYCYKDDTIYGFGEVKNIIDPQRTLNEMDYKEYKSLKRNSNSGWLADHESGVTADKLTDDEGIVVLKAKGTEVRRLEPGVTSPQLSNRIQSDSFSMEAISGMNEATQGISPSANSSGAAISNLQNQAIGRIRLKDRYLQHYSMKRLAKITASLIIGNWSTEKKLRLNTDSGNIEELVFDPIKMQDLSYSVEIAPGSMAGVDKEALNRFIIELYKMQVITAKDVLVSTDFPKRELLLKALLEREQQAEQQAAQQQQVVQEQSNNDLAELKKENIKLKARIDINLLTNEEQAIYKDIVRSDAIDALTGNIGAITGQPNNQGI